MAHQGLNRCAALLANLMDPSCSEPSGKEDMKVTMIRKKKGCKKKKQAANQGKTQMQTSRKATKPPKGPLRPKPQKSKKTDKPASTLYSKKGTAAAGATKFKPNLQSSTPQKKEGSKPDEKAANWCGEEPEPMLISYGVRQERVLLPRNDNPVHSFSTSDEQVIAELNSKYATSLRSQGRFAVMYKEDVNPYGSGVGSVYGTIGNLNQGGTNIMSERGERCLQPQKDLNDNREMVSEFNHAGISCRRNDGEDLKHFSSGIGISDDQRNARGEEFNSQVLKPSRERQYLPSNPVISSFESHNACASELTPTLGGEQSLHKYHVDKVEIKSDGGSAKFLLRNLVNTLKKMNEDNESVIRQEELLLDKNIPVRDTSRSGEKYSGQKNSIKFDVQKRLQNKFGGGEIADGGGMYYQTGDVREGEFPVEISSERLKQEEVGNVHTVTSSQMPCEDHQYGFIQMVKNPRDGQTIEADLIEVGRSQAFQDQQHFSEKQQQHLKKLNTPKRKHSSDIAETSGSKRSGQHEDVEHSPRKIASSTENCSDHDCHQRLSLVEDIDEVPVKQTKNQIDRNRRLSTPERKNKSPKSKRKSSSKKEKALWDQQRVLKYLFGELQAIINNKENLEVQRICDEIQQTVDTLPFLTLEQDVQTEIALALQPLRSENCQLRRKLRIVNQQMREIHKRQRLKEPQIAQPSFEALALQSLNKTLEDQLRQEIKEKQTLTEKNIQLQSALEEMKEKMDVLQRDVEKKDQDNLKIRQDSMSDIVSLRRACQEAEQDTATKGMKLENLKKENTFLQDILKTREADLQREHESIGRLEHLLGSVLASGKHRDKMAASRDLDIIPSKETSPVRELERFVPSNHPSQTSQNVQSVSSGANNAFTGFGVEDVRLEDIAHRPKHMSSQKGQPKHSSFDANQIIHFPDYVNTKYIHLKPSSDCDENATETDLGSIDAMRTTKSMMPSESRPTVSLSNKPIVDSQNEVRSDLSRSTVMHNRYHPIMSLSRFDEVNILGSSSSTIPRIHPSASDRYIPQVESVADKNNFHGGKTYAGGAGRTFATLQEHFRTCEADHKTHVLSGGMQQKDTFLSKEKMVVQNSDQNSTVSGSSVSSVTTLFETQFQLGLSNLDAEIAKLQEHLHNVSGHL